MTSLRSCIMCMWPSNDHSSVSRHFGHIPQHQSQYRSTPLSHLSRFRPAWSRFQLGAVLFLTRNYSTSPYALSSLRQPTARLECHRAMCSVRCCLPCTYHHSTTWSLLTVATSMIRSFTWPFGDAENAGLEKAGPWNLRGWKTQDWQWRNTLTGGPWTNYIKGPIPHFEFMENLLLLKY